MTSSVPPAVKPLPAAYRYWTRAAEHLLRPLANLMENDRADLAIEGQASNHGLAADRLESFARPCLWASHWLVAESSGEETLSRAEVAAWFRQGLVLGTDPASPQYWGPTTNFHQHTVEMGALVLAMEKASAWLWEPLDENERNQIARWLGSVRGVGLHRNNHLFFGVLPLSFLLKHGYGSSADQTCVFRWMDIMEGMHLGGGWFIDGMNESIDHYNAYAFHYYGLWWGMLYGASDPSRASRWADWTHSFLSDYARFFAASGEPVPFGRSMTYRFAASAPFALAVKCGVSPLAPGLSRRICTQNLRFFLDHKIQQRQGALSLGWTDEFPAITEAYSCAGSTYWAAKGLSPLLLEPTDPFWTDAEKPLPCEEGDFSHAIPQIGMVIRSDQGEVELLNAASSICGGNTAFGAYKWGKLSFRTGVGLEVKPKDGLYPLDASLTAEAADGTLYGRQSTHPWEIEDDHISSVYALGDRFSQFNVQVESHLWWHGGWQLHLHRYRAHQPARLILGAYSISSSDASSLQEDGAFPQSQARGESYTAALHSLHGFSSIGRRFATGDLRAHILAPHSLTIYLQTEVLEGEGDLLALSWVGTNAMNVNPWTVARSAQGALTLVQAGGEKWSIQYPALPALS